MKLTLKTIKNYAITIILILLCNLYIIYSIYYATTCGIIVHLSEIYYIIYNLIIGILNIAISLILAICISYLFIQDNLNKILMMFIYLLYMMPDTVITSHIQSIFNIQIGSIIIFILTALTNNVLHMSYMIRYYLKCSYETIYILKTYNNFYIKVYYLLLKNHILDIIKYYTCFITCALEDYNLSNATKYNIMDTLNIKSMNTLNIITIIIIILCQI